MAGTKDGAAKARKTILQRYGEDFYVRAGAKGGKVSGKDLKSPKGFAGMSPEKRSAAGKVGGAISKRRKKKDV